MRLKIYKIKSHNNYRSKRRIYRKTLNIIDGRNQSSTSDRNFDAREEDFLYIEMGSEYRYSVMMKDIFVSG